MKLFFKPEIYFPLNWVPEPVAGVEPDPEGRAEDEEGGGGGAQRHQRQGGQDGRKAGRAGQEAFPGRGPAPGGVGGHHSHGVGAVGLVFFSQIECFS